ncbi:MAG: tyrosine--tRNA ligase [Planctomycetota bacterium]
MIHEAALRKRLATLERTIESVIPEEAFRKKLEAKRPLRCKLGMDPTSPTVHIGNAIALWNLRRLQDLGHVAVLILGDYTARVGDPSGKDKTRPMLAAEAIERNLETWLEQVAVILDMERVEIHRNGEWFSKMSFLDVLSLADRMTVGQIMERDSFEKRWKANEPISVREFLYCLMQGWDSVMVRADVELGGTDQTFNLTVGRRFMAQEGLAPQVSLLSPLLEGTDGAEKMSKSLGNAIGIREAPRQMFGKAMRIPDDLTAKYLRLTTDLPDAEIERLLALENPRDAKLGLAEALVERYHGGEVARREREEFLRVFSRRDEPSLIADLDVGACGEDGCHWIVDLLKRAGFAKSTNEARHLIEGGGVRIDEVVVGDWQARVRVGGGEILRVGRRRHARLVGER